MATGSNLTNDVLTGSGADSIYTGSDTWEWVGILFRNYSGGDVNLKIFVNGTTDAECVYDADLGTGESVYFQSKLGAGDEVLAEAGAATSISWFAEKDALA